MGDRFFAWWDGYYLHRVLERNGLFGPMKTGIESDTFDLGLGLVESH